MPTEGVRRIGLALLVQSLVVSCSSRPAGRAPVEEAPGPEGGTRYAAKCLRVKILRDEPYRPPKGYQHKYGGSPTFAARSPDCKACKRPLLLLFQFDLRDPQLGFLGLTKLSFLPVLFCVDCDLLGGYLYYRVADGEIAVLHSDATESFDHWKNACPERNVAIRPVPEDEQPSSYADPHAWWEHMLDSDTVKHQLGGRPFWVQNERECSCPECRGDMRFVAQVDSEWWPIPGEESAEQGHIFGDAGVLYVFCCDACNIIGVCGDCY